MEKPQIFFLHFAGGNSYSFQSIANLLKDFKVCPLELPGRGRRMKEPLITDFELAAQDFYNQIIEKLTSPNFIIYGHSMGAYLALKVGQMLEKSNRFPSYLIVSGNAGPGVAPSKNRHLLPIDDFIQELIQLGGFPSELIENAELLNFFIPILRADFQIAEKHQIYADRPVAAPIYAIMGDKEERIDQISNWKRFTFSNFKYQILEGGHFFIHDHPEKIATIIKEGYGKIALL